MVVVQEERCGRPEYIKMGEMQGKLALLRILSHTIKVHALAL